MTPNATKVCNAASPFGLNDGQGRGSLCAERADRSGEEERGEHGFEHEHANDAGANGAFADRDGTDDAAPKG